jgi:nicotinate-nucleotide--dimethylbenzimidazole phosphoribosyltransferase
MEGIDIGAAMAAHLDNLTKPVGSLGKLEGYAIKLAVIQGRVPPRIRRKAVYVFAADHGVVDEGVSLYPREVTAQMLLNILGGGAAINALARGTGWEVVAVDAGIAADVETKTGGLDRARFVDRKIGRGTRNFLREDAMTDEELARALEAGACLAAEAEKEGYDLVAIGDMGIGNTTAAAALLVALGMDADAVVDRGTGIDDAALLRKRAVIGNAVRLRGPFSSPREALRKVGGYDLAMMAGFALGLKGRGIGCVLDGFPVTSAAYAAWRMDREVVEYCFAGHRSRVKGHTPILEALGLDPIVSLDMRLGEGTGAAIGGFLVELAAKAAGEMASFASAAVSKGSADEQKF